MSETNDSPTRYEVNPAFGTPGVADSACLNCGIGLTEAPDHDRVHAIRMLYHAEEDGGHLCEACFFDSYDRTGREIVRTELETFYCARKHREGEPDHHYDYWYFETYQAASGWARANDGEYLGGTELDPFKLQVVDE